VIAAPELSIVVAVYNVADDLPACLDSILGQAGPAFEVIAVDDASTDDSPAILADFAQRDPRIVVIRHPRNGGLGRARNTGMARARAPYVAFVDSDDLLPPGALARIAGRIAETDRPDVVMAGFARVEVDGRVVPDRNSRWLAPPMCGPLGDRPKLLEILPTAWNKVYRRDFLVEHGFQFPVGVYEDVPWTFPILISAARIATLDAVCYLYRQHDRPHLLNSSGTAHYDVFTQYDRLFGFLDAHPELEAWRRPLFDRLLGHAPTILDLTSRIPPAERRAFYAAMTDTVRRHRPDGYLPKGAAGLKVLLMTHGNYPMFRVAQLVKRVLRESRARLRAA
jgi:glycosyltransferase involved in cell wall biosynthesis